MNCRVRDEWPSFNTGRHLQLWILLLEMFIGKRPIDEMFKDGLSIHKFAAMASPQHVMDIVKPSMFFEEDEENANDEIEERQIIEEDLYVNVSS
nr:putative lrr receptor-like serine/threonine-protein kinase [Quercus suber]